jgi:hypothetical protein
MTPCSHRCHTCAVGSVSTQYYSISATLSVYSSSRQRLHGDALAARLKQH